MVSPVCSAACSALLIPSLISFLCSGTLLRPLRSFLCMENTCLDENLPGTLPDQPLSWSRGEQNNKINKMFIHLLPPVCDLLCGLLCMCPHTRNNQSNKNYPIMVVWLHVPVILQFTYMWVHTTIGQVPCCCHQSSEDQYQRNQIACGGLQYFRYGCSCKEAPNSKNWVPHTSSAWQHRRAIQT